MTFLLFFSVFFVTRIGPTVQPILIGSAFGEVCSEIPFLLGTILFPKFSEGIFHVKRKCRITFEQLEIDENFQGQS